jgi:hypothetical protein
MEIVEFIIDCQRYATLYSQLACKISPTTITSKRVCSSWEQLIQTYIIPCAAYEVNIPCRVRERLLVIKPNPDPPPPTELKEAANVVRDLINPSLFLHFLHSIDAREKITDSHCQLDKSKNKHSIHSSPAIESISQSTPKHLLSTSVLCLQLALHTSNKGWEKMAGKLGVHRRGSKG